MVITKEEFDADLSVHRLNMSNDKQNDIEIRDEDIRMDGQASWKDVHILSPMRGLASAYGDEFPGDELICKSPNHFRF